MSRPTAFWAVRSGTRIISRPRGPNFAISANNRRLAGRFPWKN
jgi:hypothetical protein